MGNKNQLGLKNDVATRWNSTFYMLERILHLKPAIAGTLLKLPSSGIEFSREDWNICEKVVTILGIFEEATKLLSGSESCNSSCIPIVTTIIQSLETTSGDDDMITMQQAMKTAMEIRFLNMEKTEHYSIATLLDPRFKHYFFRSQDACHAAKKSILTQLDSFLPSLNEPKPISKGTSLTGFSNLMKNIIAQSQATTNQSSNSRLTKEVLNDSLDSQIFSDCLDFCKIYEKNSSGRVKLALAKIAKKFLTPPPTSTDVERLFSTAGDILTNERNRLLPENLEKLLFCRENLPNVNFRY
ncbi:zinc finger BED domain-containing protein 4-like [Hydra vulgaris]|uniref:Zinc finger BED domain-containing protein 4-like n=1 Tax=Hydra vulgaris TaxID=6087 RepID=A0ABM4CAB8_HYDVU